MLAAKNRCSFQSTALPGNCCATDFRDGCQIRATLQLELTLFVRKPLQPHPSPMPSMEYYDVEDR